MKATTIYRTEHGNYSLSPGENKTPVEGYFLHTKSVGDWNKVTFLKKRPFSTKSDSRCARFFIPGKGADQARIKSELKRGREFFSPRDGFLPGAMIDLAKMGEFVTINL